MKNLKLFVLFAMLMSGMLLNNICYAQEFKVPKVGELPEYIVVTSENTKLLGGINISIDYKKSKYRDKLSELEHALQSGKGLRIRNQTDLLNEMSDIGFEYVDAYNAQAGTLGALGGDDVAATGSKSKFRTNMVFRKKEKFRD